MASVERVLFVHAHPDDETIETGGTIATLIQRGAAVTVLTCTRGERGEIIPEDLRSAIGSPAALATLRTAELRAAMAALGVTDHRFLGEANARGDVDADAQRPHGYTDSGMSWGADGAEATGAFDPTSLDGANFGDVVIDVAAVIRDMEPTAVVSYDARGGYGHPDHIRAHDAAARAAEAYRVPFYAISADGPITVDVVAVLDRKRAALAAYRSQLTLEHDEMIFPGGQRHPVTTRESYRLETVPGAAPVPYSDQRPAARFFAAVLGGIIGVALGGLLTVYNQVTTPIAGQPIWIGAIAATLITFAVFAGFRLAFGTRVVAGFAAVGMIVVVGVFSLPSAGGSVLIAANGPGILWEIVPTIAGVLVLAWPQGRRRKPGRIEKASTGSVKGPQLS